jgi:ketosteroid isomerase-like protein
MRKVITHGPHRGCSNHGRQIRDSNRRGTVGRCAQLLHDDFVGYEAGGLPYSGEYHGPQGFFELMAKMNDGLDVTLGPSVQFLSAEETVAVRFRLAFTSRATGESIEMGMVEVYTVREGLIVELDVYYKDPSAVTALLET